MGNEQKKAIFARAFEQIATRALSGARSLRHLPIKEFSRNPSLFIGNISLASLFAAVLSLLAAGTVRLVASELSTSAFTLLALGLLLLLVAVGTGFDSIRANLMTRKGFYGFNTTAMILIFVAIASIIIFVGTKNNARYDVTAAREFTLSRQTVDILRGLKDRSQEIEAVAFFVPTDPLQIAARIPALTLLEEYQQTTSRFSYRIIDPDLEPEEARRLGINPDAEPGTIVFNSGSNLQPVNTLQFTSQGQFVQNDNLEQDFSQAILAVTREKQKQVFFLEGHDEGNPASLENSGFGVATLGLEGDNYLVNTLHLYGQSDLLNKDVVLIIAGPKTEMPDEHFAHLDSFLDNGGKALFLVDPDTPKQYRDLLRKWGVDLGDGTVVDTVSFVSPNQRSPMVQRGRYNYLAPSIFSPITQPVTQKSFYSGAAAVIPIEDQGSLLDPPIPNVFYSGKHTAITPLAVTSDFFSWLETNPDPEANQFDPGEIRGPFALAVSIDAEAPFGTEVSSTENRPRTQIVVFGDSDFASNRFFTSFGNGDIFLNSVNWLAGDVDLISVRPKLREPRLLIVTTGEFNFIRWSSLLILPVLVAGAGVVLWWRRR